jgi:hypothetical protein
MQSRIAAVFAAITCLAAAPPGTIALGPGTLKASDSIAAVSYRGVPAVRQTAPDDERAAEAVLDGTSFRNGTIELDVAGDVRAGAPDAVRGFVGVAFNISEGASEIFYLRTLNGRSSDQAQRNHAVQYMAEPDWGWRRLRTQTPSKYEAYADLVPAAWTHIRIVVTPREARLYLGMADQPALIAERLLASDAPRPIAIWTGPGSIAHFANLNVRAQ